MLLRLCSQHYFILVMNLVTFYSNNNNNNKKKKKNKNKTQPCTDDFGSCMGKGERAYRGRYSMVQRRWEQGTVLENGKAKLVWDFEFNLRKTNTSRRPDLILEYKESKKI